MNSKNYSIRVKTGVRSFLVIMLLIMPMATLFPGTNPLWATAFQMHFISLAFLAFLACASFESNLFRIGAVMFVFIYSALMEFFQHYLPFRHGTWVDVGFNAIGCLVGVGFFVAQRSTFYFLNSRFRF